MQTVSQPAHEKVGRESWLKPWLHPLLLPGTQKGFWRAEQYIPALPAHILLHLASCCSDCARFLELLLFLGCPCLGLFLHFFRDAD
jgi:hypothetical protein